ncbi:MAG: NlpC/P60 family protein [bacterium]|nr:NlpC/P60 family protein [bacterium]
MFISNKVYAVEMTVYGIKGNGTWDALTNPKSFKGTTTQANGPIKGTWKLNSVSNGNWEGVVLNENIKATWTGTYTSFSADGTWIGSNIAIDKITTGNPSIIGDTFATIHGEYLPASFEQIFFKYGTVEPLQSTTLPEPSGKTPVGQEFIPKQYSTKIVGLTPKTDTVPSVYYFRFCGKKADVETCGVTHSFGTAKAGENPFDWANLAKTIEPTVDPNNVYTFLAPLSEDLTTFDASVECAFTNYANKFIKIFIGICALLAMVMIISGGIQYMTSELVSSEVQGKTVILQAILGLILAVSGYAILNTINPKLLDLCIDKNLPDATVEVDLGGESSDAFKSIDHASLRAIGITKCTGTGGKAAIEEIGKQFIGKTIYSQAVGKRNTINGNNIILDCSAYVAQVYSCAGLPYPGGNSNEMFSSNAQSVNGATFDFNQLNIGDLVGWKPSDDKRGNGHVMIYLGNGRLLDTQNKKGDVTNTRSLDSLKNRIKYVKWPK